MLLAPSDPCVPNWGNCWYGSEEEFSHEVVVRRPGIHRAAVQRRVANEWGYDFGEVRCLARWGRIMSRQDAWDAYGKDRWDDDHYLDNTPTPDKPPLEWDPGSSDYSPVWEFCDPYAEGATPIFICEGL